MINFYIKRNHIGKIRKKNMAIYIELNPWVYGNKIQKVLFTRSNIPRKFCSV